MLIVAIVPLIVCIIGLLLYLLAKTNPDLKEIGRALFWCGLLVTLFAMAGKAVSIGGGG